MIGFQGITHVPRAALAKTITTTTGGKSHTGNIIAANYTKGTPKGTMLVNKPIAPASGSLSAGAHLIPSKIQTIKTVTGVQPVGSHSLGVSSTITQASGHHPSPLNMASIIRGVQLPPQRVSTPPQAHSFQTHLSHVPRGQAAAINALTIPKPGGMTAVLRAHGHQITHVTTTPSGVMSSLSSQLQGRAPLISSLRPGTPPSTITPRPGSPSVVAHGTPTSAVQITIQPQRTAGVGGAVATHKPVHIPQQTLAQAQQKVVMATTVPQQQLVADSMSKSGGPASSLAISTTTVPSITTIPIAKVHPQRQFGISHHHTTSLHSSHHHLSQHQPQSLAPSGAIVDHHHHHHKSINVPKTTSDPKVIPTTLVHATASQSASTAVGPAGSHHGIYLSQSHRVIPAGHTIQSATSLHSDRPLLPRVPHLNQMAGCNNKYLLSTYYNPAMYQHHPLAASVYQQQTGQQHTAFTDAVAGAASLRPNLTAGKGASVPNLAASLQAAAAAHSTSATPTGAVRINSMMVSVDTNRHVAMQPHYTMSSATTVTTSDNSSLSSQNMNQSSLTTSPRPSILRKRQHDTPIIVKKCVSDPSSATSSPRPDTTPRSNTSSPGPKSSHLDLSMIRDMTSQDSNHSSTDTASSAENSTNSTPTENIRIKSEPLDSIENGGPSIGTPTHHLSSINSIEASPRKKPRKQLLHATPDVTQQDIKEESVNVSSGDELETVVAAAQVLTSGPTPAKRKKCDNYVDDEGVKWVSMRKRNHVALLQSYNYNWKSRNNHFLRYSDVKSKDERRPTVNELSNQKGVQAKAGGWKMFHLSTQMDDIIDLEKDVKTKIKAIQDCLAPQTKHYSVVEDDLAMVHELTQGNMQRCQLVADQVEEAKQAMMKILDHKTKVMDIVSKHHSKRTVKKKERS
ncbi:uncharacterized protein LOC141910509 [Tubulanus polymorphus]|uniref:uncharacterized protein LOC141910509 n=1 Tax=Tubulanus polymorphus TaxID=672921 RepID=UPI003DA5F85C